MWTQKLCNFFHSFCCADDKYLESPTIDSGAAKTDSVTVGGEKQSIREDHEAFEVNAQNNSGDCYDDRSVGFATEADHSMEGHHYSQFSADYEENSIANKSDHGTDFQHNNFGAVKINSGNSDQDLQSEISENKLDKRKFNKGSSQRRSYR